MNKEYRTEIIHTDNSSYNKPVLKSDDILTYLRQKNNPDHSTLLINLPRTSLGSNKSNKSQNRVWFARSEQSSIPVTTDFFRSNRSYNTQRPTKFSNKTENDNFENEGDVYTKSFFMSTKLRIPIPDLQSISQNYKKNLLTERKNISKINNRNLSTPLLGRYPKSRDSVDLQLQNRPIQQKNTYSSQQILKPIGKIWKSKGVDIESIPVSKFQYSKEKDNQVVKISNRIGSSENKFRRRISQIEFYSLTIFNEYNDNNNRIMC